MDTSVPPPPPGYTITDGPSPSAPPPPPPGYTITDGPQQPASQPQGKSFGGYVDQALHDVHGAFNSAVFNGFGGLVARHLYTDVLGVPKDEVNAAVNNIRQKAAQEQQDNAFNINIPNPFAGKPKPTVPGQPPPPAPGWKVDPLAFATGIVGGVDPTYLINPAEGVMKSAGLNAITNTALRTGAKAAANVASHAALNAASNAAYQGADMLDGLKQSFDTDEMLHAAELGGAFGAIHSAAPFVKQLFKTRNGIDTTPAAEPAGTTNPMSTGLTPDQLQDYHSVLSTGNESDIHNFFNDKNVVPPTHEDIHDWVNRRDGNGPQSNLSPDDLTQNIIGTPDNRPIVEQHIQQLTQGWKNPPDVEVINHTDDIQDPKIQAEAKAANADDPNALGFYGSDGKVRLFASKMTNAEDINAALFHEALGHSGLANAFGDRLDRTLNTLINRNVGQFGKAVAAELQANGAEYGGNKTRAAEEVLSNMSEQGPLKPAISDAIEAQIRGFGRKMGIGLSYSDAEVRAILRMAHQSVVDGSGRDVVGNGFSTIPRTETPLNFTDNEPAVQAPHADDGFMSAQDMQRANQVPTTAQTEAFKGPYVAKPEEFPTANPYKPTTVEDPNSDGFMTPEQMAQPIGPRFMRRTELAASKDYVAHDLEGIYKSLDRDYVPETRSFDEIRRSALELGFKPSQIKDISDVGDLSTKLYRLQSAANMADQKLAMLNERLGTDKWTMDDMSNYLTTLADRDYLIQRVKGNRAEIARALNISKAASSYSVATMQAVADKLREQGSGLANLAEDPVKFMKFAQQIKELMNTGNKAGARLKIAGVNKPYWEQYLNSFHFNAMLSALSTHVKAPVDMSTGILRDVLEKSLAIPIGAARKGLGALAGKNLEDGVSLNELALHTYGMAKSVINMEVYKAMINAVKTGEGGYVGPDGQFKPINVMNQYGSTSNPDLGPILSFPSHLVAAQDVFFRSNAMMSNMYSLAARQAKRELGPGASFDDINVRASAIAHEPTDALLRDAKDLADRTLLLNHNALNDVFGLNKTRTLGPNSTVGQRVGAFTVNTLAPFIRVESNSLINRIIQRSPLAILDPYTRSQLAMGGPQADIAMAKILYGTVSLGMAWAAAGTGSKLTGGVSPNANKRAELLAGGEVPNAIYENGKYDQGSNLAMSLFPWDQHNATAQIVKSARDAFETASATPGQKMVGLRTAFESVLHNLADMSWVSSASPAIDTLTSNESTMPQKIARFAGDTAKTFVPNISNQIERMTDVRRDTRPDDPGNITGQTINDIKSAIPGLAQSLPVKYSVYGEPLQTGATPEGIHSLLGEGNNFKTPTDPAEIELSRLAGLTKAAIVTPTQNSIKVNGVNIKLTAQQASDYQKYAGQTIVQAVKSQMENGSWQQQSDQDKIGYIRTVQSEAKKQVRETLLQQPGWLNSNQLSLLRSQGGG